jgi:TolB-like protein/tetratricopeptide (TPR) repeat protein
VYALGVLLHEMLTGDVPSRRSGAVEVPALPALGALIARALQENPVKRQRDAGDVLAGLSGLQRELERASTGHAARVVLKRPRRSRARAAVTVAIGLVAVLGVGGAVVLYRRTITPPSVARVAVLPFKNLSGDSGQEYLGDGIAQEIAWKLTTVVPVVAGSSVERYKHANPGALAIGRELDVAYIVEGGVARSGARIVVNTSVTRTADSRRMWSDKVDVPLEETLDVPERVASRVVLSLGLTLGSEQRSSIVRSGTRSTQAYDEFLQGEFALNSLAVGGRLSEARVHYERAVALDPRYAQALARLAALDANEYRDVPTKERYDRAKGLIERALSIDPHLGIAREARAFLRANAYDWQGAATEFEALVRDEPLNWQAWDFLCWTLGYVWPQRLAEAERACLRARELNPNDGLIHYHLVRALAQQGKHAEAEKAQQQVERLNAGTIYVAAGRFAIAMAKGRLRDALAVISKSGIAAVGKWETEAAALSLDGQIDEAFARLEKSLQAGFRDVAELRNAPWYEPLRQDPRFEKLLAKYGLGH